MSETKSESKKDYCLFFFLFFLIAGLMPWLVFSAEYALRTDVAWHLISSSRFIEGGTMAKDLAETNPPLIILVYAVPAFIAKITGLPIYYFPFYMMLVLNILSALAVYGLLRTGKILEKSLCAVAAGVYLIGLTQLTGYETGQREHLIITGLLPFFLAQYAIDKKADIPNWLLYGSLILGGILILLKPHYGLLPSVIFIARALRQGIPSVLKSPDFIVLFALTASYIAICFLFFSDYITLILPDVLKLYLPYGNDKDVAMITGGVFAGLIAVLVAVQSLLKPCKDDHKDFIYALLLAALVCVVPPVLQAKGFLYHFLPAMVMIAVALGVMIYDFLEKEIKSKAISGFLVSGLFLFMGYGLYPVNAEYPTHKTFANLPFPKLLNEHAAGGNFYVFMDNIGMAMPSALYTKAGLASRQPVNWFFIAFAEEHYYQNLGQGKIEEQELAALKAKYNRIMVEDLQRYKPEIFAIAQPADDWPEIFNDYYFFDFYSAEEFKSEWSNYEHFGEIVNEKDTYHKGLMQDSVTIFDVYKRKN